MLFNLRCVGELRILSKIQIRITRHGVSRGVEIKIQVLAGIDERVMDRLPERNGMVTTFQSAADGG
jgi:hypothetical protein